MSGSVTVDSTTGPASSAADDDATDCRRDDGRGFLQGGVAGAESPMAPEKMRLSARSETPVKTAETPVKTASRSADVHELDAMPRKPEQTRHLEQPSSRQNLSTRRADFDELGAMPRKLEQKRQLEQPSSRQNLSTQMIQMTATVVTVNAVVTATWKRSSQLWVGGAKAVVTAWGAKAVVTARLVMRR